MSVYANWIAIFKQQLLADKKKSAVLGVLLLVFLCVGGRMLFSKPGGVPAHAEAQPVAAVSKADSTPITMRPVPAHVGSAPPLFTASPNSITVQPVDAAPGSVDATRRVVSVKGMPRDLARDLFDTPSWSQFLPALEPSGTSGKGKNGKDGAFWARLLQSALEQETDRRRQLAEMSKELEEFHLQSTVTGPLPMTYISGHFLHEGESYKGFSVVRIGERRVTLRKAGLTRELVMP